MRSSSGGDSDVEQVSASGRGASGAAGGPKGAPGVGAPGTGRRDKAKLGEGVIVPIVTPLREDETVDPVGMHKVIEYILAGGVHGVFVMGSTGEFARMPKKEWEKAVDSAVEATAGRAPVYVGVSAPGARQALARARTAKARGADAVVLSPGFYFPVSQEEIHALYTAASECGLPVFAYNIPVYTHVTIAPETYGRLVEAGAVAGIKDSSGDAHLIQEYLDAGKGFRNLSVLIGSESIMRQAFFAGASGSVPSLANLFPLLLVEIYDAATRGKWERVGALCDVVNEINQLNAAGGSLGVVAWKKRALEEIGICSARMTEPAPKCTGGIIEKIKDVLVKHSAWMAPRPE